MTHASLWLVPSSLPVIYPLPLLPSIHFFVPPFPAIIYCLSQSVPLVHPAGIVTYQQLTWGCGREWPHHEEQLENPLKVSWQLGEKLSPVPEVQAPLTSDTSFMCRQNKRVRKNKRNLTHGSYLMTPLWSLRHGGEPLVIATTLLLYRNWCVHGSNDESHKCLCSKTELINSTLEIFRK